MSERAPYSRVYWAIVDDPKFHLIYDSDAHLAAWLRLLLIADQAWPASGQIPAGLRNGSLRALTDCALVTISGRRFRVKGLEAEREKRKNAATQTGPKRDPNGTQTGASAAPKRDPDARIAEPSRAEDETSLAEPSPRDPADIYWQLTGKYPVGKLLTWIDESIERYGTEAIVRGLVTAHTQDSESSKLMSRAQDLWRREARELDLKEREQERERLREKRAQPRVLEPWQAEFAAKLAAQYAEDAA